MKEIFKTFISLIILLILSTLIYLAWIINKGEFTSQYLEKFINDRFKSENFYTSIKNPRINFDKEEMRIIVDGENFNIFSIDEKKISEFKNLKVYINFLPLITKRKLVTNKIEMFEGKIESSSVFSEPLIINSIDLEGNLDLGDKEIIIDKFSTSIKEDFYQGTANLNLKDFKADGVLTKLLRKKIFYNLDLNSENMKFSLDKNSFSIEGDATLGETDVLLKGKKNYIDLSKFVSKYSLSGKIDENAIEKLFKLKATPYIKGPIDFNASYFIFKDNKERIKTSNNLKDVELKIPALNITKYKGTEATADIDFNFSNKKLKEIKIINYKQENKEMKGLVKLSKEFKPYKSLELDLKNNGKKTSIKIIKNKNLNTLDLKGDYLDFSETLKETLIEEQKEDSFLVKLQPVKINLEAKEILVGEEKSIYKVDAILKYENKLFKEAKVYSKLKDEKEFSLTISPKENSRELVINSNDAGLFLRTFSINKSGKEGEFVLHGDYDDTKETHPLTSSVTIRSMRLIKAPTLAKILNLASIGIVSALSGEGILINKLKSEFVLEKGVLNLNKYEAYGPDVGFSNQGNIYLRKKEVDLEGAIIPMVTLNKIIGSIPVLGKILTNERKGIWSFVYTIKGDLDEPEVRVNPIKTITPGFIQKFFSVFKTDKKEEKD
ncbi:MAG: AsmA-like C-terminal region-containing protein [Alphaproteobacteria bacterium]|nr:AsmA-like C-terminal region-containing protein [Alphaproteobacteria bacterium]